MITIWQSQAGCFPPSLVFMLNYARNLLVQALDSMDRHYSEWDLLFIFQQKNEAAYR